MSIWKTIAGAAAMAAIVVMAPQARAAQPGVLVTGDNLPTNLDPHQIFDVPMMLSASTRTTTSTATKAIRPS